MLSLCRAASGELRQRLRGDIDLFDIKEQFVAAAGMLALSLYMAAGARPAVSSFKAGNLAVTCADGGETVSAAALRALSEKLLRAYLRDGDFGFLGVRG